MSKRGVVVAAPFVPYDEDILLPSWTLDPASLRIFLLYWDEIDWPQTDFLGFPTPPDFEFLQTVGRAKRTHINVASGAPLHALAIAQRLAFLQINDAEPGCWSLAQDGQQFSLPPEWGATARSIDVELYQALPAPPEDVPLADILEFKDKRQSELGALRVALDTVYLDTVRSADIPRAKTAAMERLEATLCDVVRVANESWVSRLIPSIKVALNLPRVVSTTLLTAAAANHFGFPLALSAAAGAVGSILDFSWGSVRKPDSLPEALKPYAYLLHAKRQLGAR